MKNKLLNESERKRIFDLHNNYKKQLFEKKKVFNAGLVIPEKLEINEAFSFKGLGASLGKWLRKNFTTIDNKISSTVAQKMDKTIKDLAKASRTLSLKQIRQSNGYKQSISLLAEDLATKKYNKPYKELTSKQRKEVITESVESLNNVITNALKKNKKNIDVNVPSGKAKKVEFEKALETLNRGGGAGKKIIRDNIKLIKNNKKGNVFLRNLSGGKINYIEANKFKTLNTADNAIDNVVDSVDKGNLKVFTIPREVLGRLLKWGIGGIAVLYFVGSLYPDDRVAVVDEEGNDVTDENNNNNNNNNNNSGGYRDCEQADFPFTYGCKASKISEIQTCLGLISDGKLGPKTIGALQNAGYDTTNGLTKEAYDNIIMKCRGSEVPTTDTPPATDTPTPTTDTPPATDTPTPATDTPTPATDTPPANDTPPATDTPTNAEVVVKPDNKVSDKTGEQVYNELRNAGVLKKDIVGRIKVKERNNADEPVDVPSADINSLSEYLKTFGYYLGKVKDKSYGDKYVWVKNKK